MQPENSGLPALNHFICGDSNPGHRSQHQLRKNISVLAVPGSLESSEESWRWSIKTKHFNSGGFNTPVSETPNCSSLSLWSCKINAQENIYFYIAHDFCTHGLYRSCSSVISETACFTPDMLRWELENTFVSFFRGCVAVVHAWARR